MKYKYIYGPVPSRRLGISLGIDPIPLKVCTFNCIYCEVARTTLLTIERKEYISSEEILLELKNFFKENKQQIDYITFSGSGEPTLNSKIGYMIKKIKKFTDIPVAVLTNASLLYRKDVRDELLNAELVKCTLDAGEEKYFKRINQPEQSLTIQRIINGIIKFSETYKGKLLIEVMLVRGVNDTEENYRTLHKMLKRIKADKVQITTVVRPSAYGFAKPLTDQELEFARKIIGSNAEIIKPLDKKTNKAYRADLEEAIIDSIAIRPQTINDLAKGLGAHRDEILKYIELLLEEEKIIEIDLRREKFYKAASKLSE